MNERNYFVDIACARIPSNPGFRGPASSVANEVFSGVKSGSAKPGRTILPKREWLLIYLASAASPCFLSTFNVFLACRSGGLIDQPRNFTVGTVDRGFFQVSSPTKKLIQEIRFDTPIPTYESPSNLSSLPFTDPTC